MSKVFSPLAEKRFIFFQIRKEMIGRRAYSDSIRFTKAVTNRRGDDSKSPKSGNSKEGSLATVSSSSSFTISPGSTPSHTPPHTPSQPLAPASNSYSQTELETRAFTIFAC